MEFLSHHGKKDNLSSFMGVLKEVERNFSDIVDTETLFGQSSEKEYVSMSASFTSIINSMETQHTNRAMSKLR